MEQIIGDLLIRHNCVIIPEFGGFVTQRTAAKIDTNLGVITPPSKSLLFNRQLINNDGLLIAELAQQTRVSYDEARLMVQQLVKSWNETLSSGQRITIDKVGFLFFDQERNICFEQDRYFNLLLSSYGLGNVHFLTETDVAIAQHKAIQQEKLEVAAAIEAVATSIVQPVHGQRRDSVHPGPGRATRRVPAHGHRTLPAVEHSSDGDPCSRERFPSGRRNLPLIHRWRCPADCARRWAGRATVPWPRHPTDTAGLL
ncbi:MAG TPA: hypothetical protein PKN38_05475, partial [Taishania sp.]|nr:hypothetical protein [Taishania sp.]